MPFSVLGDLFHRPSTAVRGDAILPLSLLHERYPDLYARQASRLPADPGRRVHWIEPLRCGWDDVVFFSPVHPAPLFTALRRSGRPVSDPKPWVLPAGRLDPSRTVIRLMRAGPDGHAAGPAGPDDYLPYSTATLRAVNRITVDAIRRLEALGPNDPWLPWVDVPHVLHRGSVPVRWFRDRPR